MAAAEADPRNQETRGRRGGKKEEVKTNPLLEEDHLKIMVGDCTSELMLRVQKAAAALRKLWGTLDPDNVGMISYKDAKDVLAKWNSELPEEADKHFQQDERVDEPRITQDRFIDIFLPAAISVPPEKLLEHLSKGFAAAKAPKRGSAGQSRYPRDSMQRQTTGDSTDDMVGKRRSNKIGSVLGAIKAGMLAQRGMTQDGGVSAAAKRSSIEQLKQNRATNVSVRTFGLVH